MAEVVGKEPVIIENVNLIINVYNIGRDDLRGLPVEGQLQQRVPLPSNGTAATGDGVKTDSKDEPPQMIRVPSNGPEVRQEQFPLGWIAKQDGTTTPFGMQSANAEIPTFGDGKLWKEVRVCLPPSMLADNETDLYCPVISCREKLPRNKSIDSHIKKHLGYSCKKSGPAIYKQNDEELHCPLVYYCQDKNCQYYVETAEKHFKAYKNLKQHYKKVHAPKLFECDLCKKTFSTHTIAETHKRMCGEKYLCSTCDSSYNSLETLQTHCRRKSHVYDHVKYKDMRNVVKQEMQSLKNTTSPPVQTPRKANGSRKLPTLLPKVAPASSEVLNSIQMVCRQAGLKVDYACQTVCTAFIQKSKPYEAVLTSPPSVVTQKKRKSTDTQTNFVKFRATCVDPKHNATNTNLDWKKVITSDSQTQTADTCDNGDEPKLETDNNADADSSSLVNDEFATISISETTSGSNSPSGLASEMQQGIQLLSEEECEGTKSKACGEFSEIDNTEMLLTSEAEKVDNVPNLLSEFMSFLEGIDSSTQTDPDLLDGLDGNLLGLDVNSGDFSARNDYVSVSSTASQTAVENIPTMSLSADDYEALLGSSDFKLSTPPETSGFMELPDGCDDNVSSEDASRYAPLFDWENIVEEVYRDGDDKTPEL